MSDDTLIGHKSKNLMDLDTGEVIQVDQITKRVYGGKAFWKVYLMDFLSVLGVFDSRQVDVFIYVVEHTNMSNNLFVGTYKKISDDVNVSSATIARIFKKLQAQHFIKKVQNGVWFVNPNVLMKGNDAKRQILLTYYNDTQQSTISIQRKKQEALPTSPDNPDQILPLTEGDSGGDATKI